MSHLFGPCELPECENEILTFSRFSEIVANRIKVRYRNLGFYVLFLSYFTQFEFNADKTVFRVCSHFYLINLLPLQYQCTLNDNLALSLLHGHTFHKTPKTVHIF